MCIYMSISKLSIFAYVVEFVNVFHAASANREIC